MDSSKPELWQLFMEIENPEADDPVRKDHNIKAMTSKSKLASIVLTGDEQRQAIAQILDQSLEELIHCILVDVHQTEKQARIQSAVIELEQKVDILRKEQGGELLEDQVVETGSASLRDGKVYLKGNPLTTVKNILCPKCHLPRLLYPRVGFNSRPVPDPTQQYCKNEPAIIIDKHDVHGQRKKGVKVKGQAKGKNKKKNDPASPASSASDPATPSTNSLLAETFELKEIDYPAAKCPNKDSHLGDHWKSVNIFATHLNGSCYLKRDRAAGRDAVAKINGTPRDSRASSPKGSNGTKRSRATEDNEGNGKKKQKVDSPRKNSKKTVPGPSKLRDSRREEKEDLSSFTTETSDTIVAAKGDSSRSTDAKDQGKVKPSGSPPKKKPAKTGKKITNFR